MQHIFIDESGSMTTKYSNKFKYFVICVIRVFNEKKLRRHIKQFISKNFEELKQNDKNHDMFENEKFKELKGSSLTYDLKIAFANYLSNKCSECFEINFIKIKNKDVSPNTYENTARAFNYFLKLFFTNRFNQAAFPFDDYYLEIDERNTKAAAKNSLEDYLATTFTIEENKLKSIKIKYEDSSTNPLIQLSDFFANLYFSYLLHKNAYKDILEDLRNKSILKYEFIFPNNK